MPGSLQLPQSLFAELGKIASIWARIEQAIIIQTSAMAAQKTNGIIQEHLRMDFKRLRERWFDLCRDGFDVKTFNKVVTPLNMELARLSPMRGQFLHGVWDRAGHGKYRLSFWEQKTKLEWFEGIHTAKNVKALTYESFLLLKRVEAFSLGKHGLENPPSANIKIGRTVVPIN